MPSLQTLNSRESGPTSNVGGPGRSEGCDSQFAEIAPLVPNSIQQKNKSYASEYYKNIGQDWGSTSDEEARK